MAAILRTADSDRCRWQAAGTWGAATKARMLALVGGV